jgi:hypothetical protein
VVVVKQTYTLAAPWTGLSFATQLGQAFIDAGLISGSWFDSFSSGGIENRVMALTYAAGKTYGKSYYWFKFDTAGVYVRMANGWNATTHVPTGVQYMDYLTTTTDTLANDFNIWYEYGGSVVSTSDVKIVRYTGVKQTWFRLEQGTKNVVISFIKPGSTLAPFANLDYGSLGGMLYVAGDRTRIIIKGGPLPGVRTLFGANHLYQYAYFGYDYFYNRADQWTWLQTIGRDRTSGLYLPYDARINANSNPSTPSPSWCPVYHSLPLTTQVTDIADPDFGLCWYVPNNSMVPGDTLTISVGAEVWEIMKVIGTGTAGSDPTSCWVARVT